MIRFWYMGFFDWFKGLGPIETPETRLKNHAAEAEEGMRLIVHILEAQEAGRINHEQLLRAVHANITKLRLGLNSWDRFAANEPDRFSGARRVAIGDLLNEAMEKKGK